MEKYCLVQMEVGEFKNVIYSLYDREVAENIIEVENTFDIKVGDKVLVLAENENNEEVILKEDEDLEKDNTIKSRNEIVHKHHDGEIEEEDDEDTAEERFEHEFEEIFEDDGMQVFEDESELDK